MSEKDPNFYIPTAINGNMKEYSPDGSRATEDGIIISCRPDFCRSPNAIVPYTIWAKQHKDANTATSVRQTKLRSHTSGSIITGCYGDEAGIGGGVKSGSHESICRPKTWSKHIFIEGNHAVRDTDLWYMNNGNTEGRLYYVVPVSKTPNDEDREESLQESAAIATYPAMDGLGNVNGAKVFHEWFNKAKAGGGKFAGRAGTTARSVGKLLSGIGAFSTVFFSQDGYYYTKLFDVPRGSDGNVRAILEAARESWNNLGMLDGLTGADKEWYDHWSGVLDDYGEKARSGVFGPTAQDMATLPDGFTDRMSREGIRVVGQAKEETYIDCIHLACQPPVGKYRGGAHWCTKGPKGDGLESHHMPAQGYGNPIPRDMGPAIQMEPEDHRMTASNPASWKKYNKDYIKQAALLASGQYMAVFDMDVVDMKLVENEIGQPNKYAAAVKQAEAYADCLRDKGLVK